jgi:predicted transcriptional regulator
MKTIIVSVKPRYAEQILNGKKTIEVRKFRLEPPFKVVNYVTKCGNDKLKNQLLRLEDTGECVLCSTTDLSKYKLNGKVAFEYVVNKVDFLAPRGIKDIALYYSDKWLKKMLENACLSCDEAIAYQNNKSNLYGFHISDLKIYDKPKELREFRTPKNCGECSVSDCYYCDSKPITRPPTNFVYIEEIRYCQSEVRK